MSCQECGDEASHGSRQSAFLKFISFIVSTKELIRLSLTYIQELQETTHAKSDNGDTSIKCTKYNHSKNVMMKLVMESKKALS